MEERKMKTSMMKMMLAAVVAVGTLGATVPVPQMSDDAIAAKAVHEIRMYTRYTIWDNVNLRVKDGSVELIGQVSQPFKKADMGRLMQRIEGVTGVTNNLEVLPLSPFDDDLRIRIARAIYREPALSRYAIQAVPPIHIIVNNGRVTLEGVVNNELEKNVAGMRAATAGLSLGQVVNNLRVENPKKKG